MVAVNENRFEFEIPDSNIAKFTNLMAKVTKKSIKLGFEPIPYTFDSFFMDKNRGKVWKVTMNAPTVKVEGWRFIAVIDHTQETGNIIRALPNETVPEKYRDADPICEHCKVRRYRRDTYVLRADDGEDHMQVGKHCLVDFLGYDPGKLAQFAEMIGRLHEDVHGYAGVRIGIPMVNLKSYLEIVAMNVRLNGWVSRSTAHVNGTTATANFAYSDYCHGEIGELIDADIKMAAAALEWALQFSQKSTLSDYEHNVLVIAESDFMEPRSIGIAASIVGVYDMNLKRAKKIQEQPKPKVASEYIGTIGEKITVPVKVVVCQSLETSTLLKFVTKEGNILTWFSTSGTNLPSVGNEVEMTGTVIRHQIYHSEKTTYVNRCKFK